MNNDNVNQILEQAKTGNVSEADVHAAYDQVARTLPPTALADGLSQAFKSDQTPPFPSMIANLFGRSNPDQKAGLLNTLLARLNPSQRTEALGAIPVATTGSASPTDAQHVTPEQAEKLAAQAERHDPSIVDQASKFYAQHPQLVKNVGAAALALLLARAIPRRH
jgi:hypothetical protein